MKLEKENQGKKSRALKKRADAPKEAAAGHGANPIDLSKISPQDFSTLMSKPEKTDEDKAYLRKVMEQAEKEKPGAFPEETIVELLADPIQT